MRVEIGPACAELVLRKSVTSGHPSPGWESGASSSDSRRASPQRFRRGPLCVAGVDRLRRSGGVQDGRGPHACQAPWHASL